MRRVGLAAVTALWLGSALAAAPATSLQSKQAEARAQQARLQERIETLQQGIDRQEASRKDAASALKASETAISDIDRRLAELAEQKRQAEDDLKRLEGQIADQRQELGKRQHELAEQLRAQYASGLSPWTALLSGDDPQAIGRELGYLSYVSQAQAKALRAVGDALDRLNALQAKVQARRRELVQVAEETQVRKTDLEKQKQERRRVLDEVSEQLKAHRAQAENLQRDEQRLGKLITGLEEAIAKQAEEARRAEARRREEARLAEIRRQEEARRLAAQRAEEERRRLEALRQAQRDEEAARQAREQVELARARERAARQEEEAGAREQEEQEAQARARAAEQEELVRARARAEEAEARARERAREQEEQESARERAREQEDQESARERARQQEEQEAGPAAEPAQIASLRGLHRGLPFPVRGEIQGRFGAERPDGGLWRGIVLRTQEGTRVKAIAAGRVVYANWLNGFGNILILDHGAQYLSVYAYNQSLLKRVGQMVAAGEAIATVGATGGQVESGLYFEIRHQGKPVNPLLWLAR